MGHAVRANADGQRDNRRVAVATIRRLNRGLEPAAGNDHRRGGAVTIGAAIAAVMLLAVGNSHPGNAEAYAKAVNTLLGPVRKTDNELGSRR